MNELEFYDEKAKFLIIRDSILISALFGLYFYVIITHNVDKKWLVLSAMIALFIFVLAIEFAEYLLNGRKVTMDKDGITIRLAWIERHYSWNEIQKRSVEDIRVFHNSIDGYTKKYHGIVFVFSIENKNRKKCVHPYVRNIFKPFSMVCIYCTPDTKLNYQKMSWRSTHPDWSQVKLFEEKENQIRDCLSKCWNVQLTYDYREDYCKDYWDSHPNSLIHNISIAFMLKNNNNYFVAYENNRIIAISNCNNKNEMKKEMLSLVNSGLTNINTIRAELINTQPLVKTVIMETYPDAEIISSEKGDKDIEKRSRKIICQKEFNDENSKKMIIISELRKKNNLSEEERNLIWKLEQQIYKW